MDINNGWGASNNYTHKSGQCEGENQAGHLPRYFLPSTLCIREQASFPFESHYRGSETVSMELVRITPQQHCNPTTMLLNALF